MEKKRNRNVKLVVNKREKYLDIYLSLSGSNEYLVTRPFSPELYRLDNTSIYDIKRVSENTITQNSKQISRYRRNSTYVKRQRNRIKTSSNSIDFLTKVINEYIMYECCDNLSLI